MLRSKTRDLRLSRENQTTMKMYGLVFTVNRKSTNSPLFFVPTEIIETHFHFKDIVYVDIIGSTLSTLDL